MWNIPFGVSLPLSYLSHWALTLPSPRSSRNLSFTNGFSAYFLPPFLPILPFIWMFQVFPCSLTQDLREGNGRSSLGITKFCVDKPFWKICYCFGSLMICWWFWCGWCLCKELLTSLGFVLVLIILLSELLLLLFQFNRQPRSYLKLGVSLSTARCVKVSLMWTSLNAPLCGSWATLISITCLFVRECPALVKKTTKLEILNSLSQFTPLW